MFITIIPHFTTRSLHLDSVLIGLLVGLDARFPPLFMPFFILPLSGYSFISERLSLVWKDLISNGHICVGFLVGRFPTNADKKTSWNGVFEIKSN